MMTITYTIRLKDQRALVEWRYRPKAGDGVTYDAGAEATSKTPTMTHGWSGQNRNSRMKARGSTA